MRVHQQVAHKSKKVRSCRRCGTEIQPGQRYYWFKHRHQGKTYFCMLHRPRPQDMTLSDKLARLYEEQDNITSAIDTVNGVDLSEITWEGGDQPEVEDDDDGESQGLHDEWQEEKDAYGETCEDLESALDELASALETAAETATDVADEYTTSADNIEEHFSSSPVADDCHSKAEQCEEWQGELESAQSDVESAKGDIDKDDPTGTTLADIVSTAVDSAEAARDALQI